jgi:ribonuclease P protein component
MLSREKRIRDTRDFKRIYQKGSFLGSDLFTINILPNRTENSRLGFVISKKVEPKAVKRNLLKRRFRAVSSNLYGQLPSGYDVVVNIKPKAAVAEISAIEAELKSAFGKVGTDEASRRRHN